MKSTYIPAVHALACTAPWLLRTSSCFSHRCTRTCRMASCREGSPQPQCRPSHAVHSRCCQLMADKRGKQLGAWGHGPVTSSAESCSTPVPPVMMQRITEKTISTTLVPHGRGKSTPSDICIEAHWTPTALVICKSMLHSPCQSGSLVQRYDGTYLKSGLRLRAAAIVPSLLRSPRQANASALGRVHQCVDIATLTNLLQVEPAEKNAANLSVNAQYGAVPQPRMVVIPS